MPGGMRHGSEVQVTDVLSPISGIKRARDTPSAIWQPKAGSLTSRRIHREIFVTYYAVARLYTLLTVRNLKGIV